MKDKEKEEEKEEEILNEDEFCYYSGLPSPMAYQTDQTEKNKKD